MYNIVLHRSTVHKSLLLSQMMQICQSIVRLRKAAVLSKLQPLGFRHKFHAAQTQHYTTTVKLLLNASGDYSRPAINMHQAFNRSLRYIVVPSICSLHAHHDLHGTRLVSDTSK